MFNLRKLDPHTQVRTGTSVIDPNSFWCRNGKARAPEPERICFPLLSRIFQICVATDFGFCLDHDPRFNAVVAHNIGATNFFATRLPDTDVLLKAQVVLLPAQEFQ